MLPGLGAQLWAARTLPRVLLGPPQSPLAPSEGPCLRRGPSWVPLAAAKRGVPSAGLHPVRHVSLARGASPALVAGRRASEPCVRRACLTAGLA